MFDYQEDKKDYLNKKTDNKSRFIDALHKKSSFALVVVIVNLLLRMRLVQ